MSRRQSRRVAGLLRQFQLLGKCFHGDRVFTFVAVDPRQQNQGVGCLRAVARRLVKLQRRLEMRHRFVRAALLVAQTAKGEAGSCFQSRRLVLARQIESLLQVRARVGEFAARQQRIPEVNQAVGCQRPAVEQLCGFDRVGGDSLGVITVARGVVHVAELQRRPDRLVLAGRCA